MSEKVPPSVGEELANSVSHGFALLASVAALPVLVVTAVRQHDPWHVVGVTIFGTTLILLYASSTLYHAIRDPHAKGVLRVLDHSAIYLVIAGSYTPFTLGVLRGPWGWSLLVAIWALALAGIALKTGLGFRYPRASTALYLLMGWLVVLAIRPLLARMSTAGLLWLLSGGLCYTFGVVFYAWERLRYGHFAWHLFVFAGSVCHFFAILWYAR
jgi:hemolysin III